VAREIPLSGDRFYSDEWSHLPGCGVRVNVAGPPTMSRPTTLAFIAGFIKTAAVVCYHWRVRYLPFVM